MKKILNYFGLLIILISSILSTLIIPINQVNLKYKTNNANLENVNEPEESSVYLYPWEQVIGIGQTSDLLTVKKVPSEQELYSFQIKYLSKEANGNDVKYNFNIMITSLYDFGQIDEMKWYITDAETKEKLDEGVIASNVNYNDKLNYDVSVTYPKDRIIKVKVSSKISSAPGNYLTSYSPSIYLYEHGQDPIINDFSATKVDSSNSQKSLKMNWIISDPDNYVDSIQLIDATTNQIIDDIPPTNLVETNYLITNLQSNEYYSYRLVINWKDPILETSGSLNKQIDNIPTSAIMPTIYKFELMNVTENNVTIQIAYNDPDSIVDYIIIHDNKNNMNDIFINPNDLENGQYQIKNLSNGKYELVLNLHCTSKTGSNTIVWEENVNFRIGEVPTKIQWWWWILILILFLVIISMVTLLIMYIVKKRNNPNNIELN